MLVTMSTIGPEHETTDEPGPVPGKEPTPPVPGRDPSEEEQVDPETQDPDEGAGVAGV